MKNILCSINKKNIEFCSFKTVYLFRFLVVV